MHKRITFSGDAQSVRALAQQLVPIEGVIGLWHQREGALKPPGDVLQVDVLNRDADQVLRKAAACLDDKSVQLSVVIGQSTAIVDRDRAHLIETDADEALWEEMESDLRNHGRISANYLVLMALGGIVAAAGLLLDPVSQGMAFVGASIIAPAFEPVAKVAQALVLGRARICGRALLSVMVGYALMIGAAALTFLALSTLQPRQPHVVFVMQPVIDSLTHLKTAPIVTSGCAAIAGIIMVVSLRDLYVVGPLIVLVTVPGLALAGAALGVGEGLVALGALRRVGSDLALIIILGAGVFAWKQRLFHRRRPLT
jgi:hypothetical protein